MDFVTLQNEVLAAGFSENYRTRVKQWLNDAQARIASELDLRIFEATSAANTVSGTAAYNLPADFRRLRYVYYDPSATADNVALEPLDGPEDYDALPTQSGTPTSFTVKNSNIVLWPTPNAVVSLVIAYYRDPATLSLDAAVPEISAVPYHDCLVEYATWRAFRREGDPERAAFWQSQFNDDVLRLGVELQHDTHARPPRQVPGAWN